MLSGCSISPEGARFSSRRWLQPTGVTSQLSEPVRLEDVLAGRDPGQHDNEDQDGIAGSTGDADRSDRQPDFFSKHFSLLSAAEQSIGMAGILYHAGETEAAVPGVTYTGKYGITRRRDRDFDQILSCEVFT